MQINIIAIGNKMPNWVDVAYTEYTNRLKNHCKINLIALPLTKQNKNIAKILEGQQILAKTNSSDYVIALDSHGKQYDSDSFAEYINKLKINSQNTKNISIIIGGPNGLSDQCLERANDKISLSKLTLPHPIVRVVLAEQLYRAFMILSGHPYHK
jgi:23S rRNA (pseudouridine1915-N3)-methyltransferase